LVSQVGVSGWCLRLVSQVGVSGWCLRLVSLLGVSTWCLCHQRWTHTTTHNITHTKKNFSHEHQLRSHIDHQRSLNDAHYDRQRYTGWVRQCTTYMHTSITPIYIYICILLLPQVPTTIILQPQSSSPHTIHSLQLLPKHLTSHQSSSLNHHSLQKKFLSPHHQHSIQHHSPKNFSHHHQHSTPFIIDHQSSIIIIQPQTPSISMPSLWTPKSPQNPYFRPLPPYPHPLDFRDPRGLPAPTKLHRIAPRIAPSNTIIPSPFNHHHSFIIHHHSITIIHSSSSFNHLYITTLVNPTPNTITSYTSMVGYSGWCLRLVSQVGVSGWCLRLVSQVGVSGWCLWEPQIWHLNK
jgi:hypothetical protein